jgi:hypothetical protein
MKGLSGLIPFDGWLVWQTGGAQAILGGGRAIVINLCYT